MKDQDSQERRLRRAKTQTKKRFLDRLKNGKPVWISKEPHHIMNDEGKMVFKGMRVVQGTYVRGCENDPWPIKGLSQEANKRAAEL